MDKTKPAPVYKKKSFLSGSVIFVVTILCLYFFFIRLSDIKKDDATAVYGVDLIAYYTAAQMVKAGEISEIYAEVKDDFSVVSSGKFFEMAKNSGFHLTPTRYVYLPIFLAPFQLLTSFTFSTVAILWLSLNLLMVITVIVLEWYFTKDLPHPIIRLMLITSLNLSLFPLFYALKLGQTSLLVYLFVCLIYLLTIKKQDSLAGIFLGIIITLKFSPLLFALYFLYRKRYTLILTCTLTVVTILLISILFYGFPLHKIYWSYLIKLSNLEIAAWSNQSIGAFLLRLFTKNSVLHFSPLKMPILLSLIRYALIFSVIGVLYSCLKGEQLNPQRVYPLEFSAIILCFLIIPSISWLHYFTLATLSMILFAVFYFKLFPFRAWILIPLMVISYAMIAFHPNHTSLIARFGQGYLTRVVASLPSIGTCGMLFMNVLLMKAFNRKHSEILKAK